MSLAAPAAVDPRLFTQALEALDRERPAHRSEMLLGLLNGLYWAALGLTVLYGIQVGYFRVEMARAKPIAVLAACAYGLIVPIFLLNFTFFNQLRRAARLQRRLATSWKSGLQATVEARSGRHRIVNLVVGWFLTVCGWLALGFGAIGLLVETFRRPFIPEQFILALLMVFFGLASMLLPYMARGRERLQVIQELHKSLVAGEIPAYIRFARFQRVQIETDREQSIKADATLDAPRAYGYQESRAVRDVKQALTPMVLVEVLAHVDRLLSEAPQRGAREAGASVRYDRIEGTDLELGYRIDDEAREVRLVSLAREGSPRPSPGDEPESSEYRISSSESVRTTNSGLSAEKRKAVDTILGDLAADPAEFAGMATPADRGNLVLRRSSPPVEVTYSVDDASKTVNVVHLSAPVPALREMFVSYSRDDHDGYVKIMKFVRRLEAERVIDIWSDERIKPGEKWAQRIEAALAAADAALLLVSQNFIDSDFINKVELPQLLDRADKGLTMIFWVPLRASTIADSTTHKRITDYQALLSPETPLSKLGEAELDEALLGIYRSLKEALVGKTEGHH